MRSGWALILGLGIVLSSAFVAAPHARADELDVVYGALQAEFPGREPGGIVMSGTDVRVILARVVPDIGKYMQAIVNHLDSLDVKKGKGRMLVDVVFEDKTFR